MRFIAERGPQAARRLKARLESAPLLLSEHPLPVPGWTRPWNAGAGGSSELPSRLSCSR
ncbi:type II toxin-antitoxin system RelE/ParE family toxin [Halomonas ramblicola]|nr:type II toxin-antitoxin system RelE/ParE family toxin [Halomonas ramblicola]MDN3521934.1 type II toxin-antitoxin system RelE/ParE family toxin [Halomonas ramblicola]